MVLVRDYLLVALEVLAFVVLLLRRAVLVGLVVLLLGMRRRMWLVVLWLKSIVSIGPLCVGRNGKLNGNLTPTCW